MLVHPDRPGRRVSPLLIAAGALAALFLLAPRRPAEAAGLLIADGGFGGQLEIKEHAVHVTLNNGIAVTEVTQVFQNLENRQVEALYTFPVPRHASVSNFSMWIDGKEMVGEVVEKQKARQIYDSYKRRRIDPGLLEQKDYKTFEMRVFPINPRAEQRVQITYYQELDADHDWVTFVYPLATVTRQDIDSRTTGAFRLTLDVKSAIPIQSMESPSHEADFVISPHSESYYQASLETRGGDLARDVVLAYQLSRPKTGIDLITSKQAGEDGYFCLTLTAGEDLAKLDAGMDYVFVLDISGSMAHGNKMRLSRGSIDAFVDALGGDDRFEVITFNARPTTLFNSLETASGEAKSRAHEFLASQRARGGTVLNPAMEVAYKYGDPDRQLNVVILSDGMTQQGEREVLSELIRRRPANSRVFSIGVGNEVNRPLLEQIATDAGGLAAFISRGDNFKRQAAAFRRKLTRPAATNVKIQFQGSSVYDVEPTRLPDLYHGSAVRLYGRYRKSGPLNVTVEGDVAGTELKSSAKLEFPREDANNPEIERMWAWQRMDRLLKEADRRGARRDVIGEIIFLGETYSIASEYTSFLVLESDAEYRRWKIERRNQSRLARDRRARERLASSFEALRSKAVAGLGPEGIERPESAPDAVPGAGARNRNANSTPPRRPAARPTSRPQATRRSGRSADFRGWGGGPVGPIFAAFAAWLLRRKRAHGNR